METVHHALEAGKNVSEKPVRAAGEVFLLGAGFSRAISEAMPLLQDLSDHLRRKWGDTDRVPSEVLEMMEDNFAHALSYLEQAKPWLTEADNLRHRALFLEFSSLIAEDLEEIVRDLTADARPAVPPWVGRLIRYWHENRCVVLTLNYDTLIESIAARTRVHDGDGIAARDMYPPLLTDAGLRSGISTEGRPRATFRLLKLHGSTNWYYSGRALAQGEPIYFVPPREREAEACDRHQLRLRSVADKYPFLVPPIFDKSALFTHETIRALWFEAGETLRRATRLVSMGYSLPESDLTMMHFLRTRLGESVELEIVDPSESAAENFQRVLARHPVHLGRSTSGPHCIRHFVESLPTTAENKKKSERGRIENEPRR